MRLTRVVAIENFRAIRQLSLALDERLTVLIGDNGQGKTSVLGAIAFGLWRIPIALRAYKGDGFLVSDISNDADHVKVILRSSNDFRWTSYAHRGSSNPTKNMTRLISSSSGDEFFEWTRTLRHLNEANGEGDLPVMAYYATDRAVVDPPQRRRDLRGTYTRLDAYQDALTAKPGFEALFEWFEAKESEELRLQRDTNPNVTLPELNAVRRAIEGMMPDVRDPHIESNPLRFVVLKDVPGGKPVRLSLEQLSGGYRIVLAMAADLARRMAIANPHLTDPLASEAVVLIDEIELHLHPSWQQRVLPDLMRTFPNAQFIVSTHSPQVLTSIEPKHIVRLSSQDGRIVAEQETSPTYGGEAGNVLSAVMGVEERPPNEYTANLRRYRDLVALDKADTPEAMRLRQETQALSPDDPVWDAIDIEIERRRTMRARAARG